MSVSIRNRLFLLAALAVNVLVTQAVSPAGYPASMVLGEAGPD